MINLLISKPYSDLISIPRDAGKSVSSRPRLPGRAPARDTSTFAAKPACPHVHLSPPASPAKLVGVRKNGA